MIISIKRNLAGHQITPAVNSLALAVIIVVAVVLRFYKLGDWSFWGDEMFTVGGREDGFNYSLFRRSLSMSLIQLLVAKWGTTEWNARFIPALIGVVSVPVLYVLVKRIFDARVGLVSSLLLTVSTWHIYWSQNARFYVALLLFYTIALFFFYLGLEKNRIWYFVVALSFLGLATKERLLALFFVPVIASYLALLWVLPFEKPPGLRWRNLLIFLLPGLVGALFFAGPYLRNLPGWMEGFGCVNNNPIWLGAVSAYYIGVPTIITATLGALYFLMSKNRAVLLLSLGAVFPLIILMGLSVFHYTASRYAFITLTSWIILAALATVELISQSRGRQKILAAGLLMLLVAGYLGEDLLYYRYQNGNRDNWKGAFALIKAEKEAGDLTVSVNPELADFYMQESTVSLYDVDLEGLKSEQQRIWFVEDRIALETTGAHAWLVDHAWLIGNLDIQAQAQNFRMRVYLYDPGHKKQNLPR